GAGAHGMSPTMDPHHDRQAFLLGPLRRPDVQVETVFGHFRIERIDISEPITLHAPRAELVSLAHAFPSGRALRSLPSQLTNGWRRVRNALEHRHVGILDRRTGHPAA